MQKEQDVLIDQLNEKLKRDQEQLALTEAQLVSQRSETAAASQTLAEANREMEAITFEKKQLLQQWKSALIGMERRDEALQAIEQLKASVLDVLATFDAELRTKRV